MRIRFRYNGLLALCIVLGCFTYMQHRHIKRIETIFSEYALIKNVKQRAWYVNRRMDELERLIITTNQTATTAEIISNHLYRENAGGPNDWMIGLTTEQVDSVLIERRREFMRDD